MNLETGTGTRDPAKAPNGQMKLRRVLTLPWLVFYGVGVTVGAGIFALVGVILSLAGDHAPQSFLLAGIIAGATGVSYALLVRVFPLAAGEAVFVSRGLGKHAGTLVGIGVLATAVISSAVISLAFAGYAGTILPLSEPALASAVIVLLAFIAWYGVRESIYFAGIITVLEILVLLVIVAFGAPRFLSGEIMIRAFSVPTDLSQMTPVLSGAILAFFAFVGFEDIENMAEETQDPERTAPKAIIWTLAITTFVYLAVSLVAVAAPDRAALTQTGAPMSALFEMATGRAGTAVSAMASIAMLNGVLVQIVMAARVLYGMANEGQIPTVFATIDPRRRTPVVATWATAAVILFLALTFPLVGLAELTSFVIIIVFALVNLSLFTIGRRHEDTLLKRFHLWGLLGFLLCLGILAFQVTDALTGGL